MNCFSIVMVGACSLDKNRFFWQPVDPERYPEYAKVVTQPMDFLTMLKRVKNDGYASYKEFKTDISLVFANAQSFCLLFACFLCAAFCSYPVQNTLPIQRIIIWLLVPTSLMCQRCCRQQKTRILTFLRFMDSQSSRFVSCLEFVFSTLRVRSHL